VPSAIYLLHSKRAEAQIVPLAQSLAEDATVDPTLKRMVFKKYAIKLRRALDIDRLAVPEKEKERYKRWLLGDEQQK
jgi:hypothetical protein